MEITLELAELLGIMYGDGCLSTKSNKYLVYISGHKVDDFKYHDITTRKLFKKVFNKDISIGFRKEENTLFIRFSDKTIFNQLVSIGMTIGLKYGHLVIPPDIKNSDELMFAFLRGLADTDGCFVLSKQHRTIPYYPRIEIASKSEPFLLSILSFLKEQGFYGSVSKKAKHFRLEVPGKKNVSLWMDKISFNNPKHIRKMAPRTRLELVTP